MDVIFKEHGQSLIHTNDPLTPRSNIIQWNPQQHQAEFDRNIKWGNCPNEHRQQLTHIIQEHWDAFAEEGLRNNIRGFECTIDTGNVNPICCKTPRYGAHETPVITQLLCQLTRNGLVEDAEGPYGALIVLAAKPNQQGTPWYEYIWRLSVSYRRLNQVTRPFTFPIPRCDDAVQKINPRFTVFISFDLDCGYWQVALNKASRHKTAFFTPNGKKQWTVMPMGFLNSHAIFVAMMTVIKTDWIARCKQHQLVPDEDYQVVTQQSAKADHGSTVIVDDVLLYATNVPTILKVFRIVLQTLIHYQVTVKLKKCKFLEPSLEFVGIDVSPHGNSPAKTKLNDFRKLAPPQTWGDLRMAIGLFGFYQEWIPLFEARIRPYRKLQQGQPKPGMLTPQEEQDFFLGFWQKEHDTLFEELKNDILSKPVLQRPNPYRRFYIKTDWSKWSKAAVLLQADPNDEKANLAEEIEHQGGPCFFDLNKRGICLHPIAFISANNSIAEQSFHSYVGEVSVARWAFPKWRQWLIGTWFTWLCDCSGIKRFFDDEKQDPPTHMMQRWRLELLAYTFVAEHRPAEMVTEVNALTRYNLITHAWRKDQHPDDTSDPRMIIPPTIPAIITHGSPQWPPRIILQPDIPTIATSYCMLPKPSRSEKQQKT